MNVSRCYFTNPGDASTQENSYDKIELVISNMAMWMGLDKKARKGKKMLQLGHQLFKTIE